MTSIPENKRIAIIGGGTNTYISNHLALSAPAYGTTAKHLYQKFLNHSDNKMDVELCLTKMADPSQDYLDTPEDVEALVDELIADPDTRVIIFNVAMVDYKPTSLFTLESNSYDAYNPHEITDKFGKYTGRLNTSKLPEVCLELSVQDKVINKIRKERKDILLVGFKTTCGATKEEQFQKGLKLCKDASANIVFVNDVDKDRIRNLNSALESKKTLSNIKSKSEMETAYIEEGIKEAEEQIEAFQNNGLVTPEESSYWYNTRDEALDALVQMVLDRSHLHFTRSTVVNSKTVPWLVEAEDGWIEDKGKIYKHNPLIPDTFAVIFDYVRGAGAYKLGPTKSTVGHMGIKLGPNEFLTSKRKTDFNKIEEVGLVRVITDDPDNVFGYKHFFENKEVRDLQDKLKLIKERSKQDQTENDKMWSEVWTEYYKDKLAAAGQKVIAFGAKPSVGGQSQRSLFDAYPNLDCIIHFHCPLKTGSRDEFNTTPQFGVECGSHECGQNTAMNMKEFKLPSGRSVWAVHLDHHGPNILFDSNSSDPQEIIEFIGTHWALDKKTTGLSDELI